MYLTEGSCYNCKHLCEEGRTCLKKSNVYLKHCLPAGECSAYERLEPMTERRRAFLEDEITSVGEHLFFLGDAMGIAKEEE